MADIRTEVEIRLWDRPVGALVELDDGPIVFEYFDAFRRSGLEISPLHLPLELKGPVRFDHLRSPSFEGLPGVFADSLPDAFGRRVIRAWFAARGEREDRLTPAQRLLYVGTRAIGALTYHPATELPARAHEMEALELRALAEDARRIVEGSVEVAVPEIYRIGSSAGGVRPKAVVLLDPDAMEVRSAYADPRPGDVPGVIKFDGVGEDATDADLGSPLGFNRIEAAYARMAAAAGIDMADVRVIEDDSLAHLFVRRFDLTASGERIHQHTLGGMIHVDYNEPGASSYEEYLRRILALGMPYAALEEGYRRAVFNVLAVNQDDHVKNLSFHMHPDGRWELTPAYDLTFAHGRTWTARHQMSLRGKREGITLSDLLELGAELTITRPREIVDAVREAVGRFPVHAGAVAAAPERIDRVRSALRRRDREVFAA